MPLPKVDVKRYMRVQKLPHIWCPGCGHGIVTAALLRAIHQSGIDRDRTVIVSGIGCSARATGYLDFDTMHTTHGRALAFATGIKLANPELHVVVLAGDGDLAAIGGNHLIHAARRNIGVTCLCLNNNIYGMTSGQYSPLTPGEAFASTAPYGHIESPFDLVELVKAAGAGFVARGTAFHARQLERLIARGLAVEGFAFIEALDQCPVYFGRKNRLPDPFALMKSQAEAYKGRVGVLHDQPRPEYTRAYQQVIERAMAAVGGEEA